MLNKEIQVKAIPAFSDNYIWAICNSKNSNVALVDPGDAKVCIEFLQTHNLALKEILITHHHNDHTGGIKALLAYAEQNNWEVTVFGPQNEKIPACDVRLSEGDEVVVSGIEMAFSIIDIPGHTLGHIAYYQDGLLFCGDTLFSGGCGRVFEGTPEQMHQSLLKLKNLPDDTLVFCAHEYTQSNLEFALNVEPNNLNLINYFNHVTNLRNNGKSTIPTSIGLEKNINPFLRTENSEIIESANLYSESANNSDSAVFKVIREWKNNF